MVHLAKENWLITTYGLGDTMYVMDCIGASELQSLMVLLMTIVNLHHNNASAISTKEELRTSCWEKRTESISTLLQEQGLKSEFRGAQEGVMS